MGGHNVPTPKIVARNPRTIANLRPALSRVNRVYVYDNSGDEAVPDLQFLTSDGAVTRTCATGHD